MSDTIDIFNLACKMAHNTNKAWCEAHDDYSQPDWKSAVAWQQEATRQSIILVLENPSCADDLMHNVWMKNKIEAGWVYGPTKCAKAKTHPCLVPFEDLPQMQKVKDALFIAVVKSIYGL